MEEVSDLITLGSMIKCKYCGYEQVDHLHIAENPKANERILGYPMSLVECSRGGFIPETPKNAEKLNSGVESNERQRELTDVAPRQKF